MKKQIIAVIGATGAQGRGIINHIVEDGTFDARALTRNPETYSGPAQEVRAVDLNDENTLAKAFDGAFGVFVVTDFWAGADEVKQATNAINAARAAGVNRFIWSSIPNVEEISGGAFDVPHFTGKATVDALVRNAGFEFGGVVQAPFYYQNLVGVLAPQPKEDGSVGWTFPLDPSKKVIHMGDISELGKVVVGLLKSNAVSNSDGPYAFSAELKSFNEILADYAAQGQKFSYTEVPADTFAGFFEGAKEIAEMMAYFEAYTYMGPDADANIQRGADVAIGSYTSFADWLKAQS